MALQAETEKVIIELISKALNRPIEDIHSDVSFPDLGMDSLAAMFLLDDLERKLNREINPLLFWEYPTIRSFAEALCTGAEVKPLRS